MKRQTELEIISRCCNYSVFWTWDSKKSGYWICNHCCEQCEVMPPIPDTSKKVEPYHYKVKRDGEIEQLRDVEPPYASAVEPTKSLSETLDDLIDQYDDDLADEYAKKGNSLDGVHRVKDEFRDSIKAHLIELVESLPELQPSNDQVGDNPRVLEAYANQNLARKWAREALIKAIEGGSE